MTTTTNECLAQSKDATSSSSSLLNSAHDSMDQTASPQTNSSTNANRNQVQTPSKSIEFRGRVVDPDAWLAEVAKCHYLPESQMITLCNILINRLVYQPNIVAVPTPATICGDIHGQFYDLLKLFEIGGPVSETNYVFLGGFSTNIKKI
jgi:hypothetical protein